MKSSLRISILPFVISAAFAGDSNSYKAFCFKNHVKESIAINKDRKKLYSKLTDGKSDRVFGELIAYERLTLIPATFYDLKVLKYQKEGIDLFCKEFLPLNHSPMQDEAPRNFPQETFSIINWKQIQRNTSLALDSGDVAEVKKVSLQALVELQSQPSYYCLTRHFIESIYRFAHFLPLRRAQAKAKGLKDPKNIIFSVMKTHTQGLRGSFAIDVKSRPIQENGIPMICAEMPNPFSDINNIELSVLKN